MKVGRPRATETTNRLYVNGDHLITLLLSARKLSLVGELPGANVKSYAGYLTVNKKYNSNLFFWFFPALKVGSNLCTPKVMHQCVYWNSQPILRSFFIVRPEILSAGA